MVSTAEPVVRDADHDDVIAICRFGETHVRAHYAPLIGAAAADEQIRRCWNETQIGAAVAERLLVVAEEDGQVVGVGQRGRRGADHVVYKLYVHPRYRGRGLGPRRGSSSCAGPPNGTARCRPGPRSPSPAGGQDVLALPADLRPGAGDIRRRRDRLVAWRTVMSPTEA